MKIYWILLLLCVFTFTFAQEEVEKKPFKKSTNRYYIGASVSPILVGLLDGNNLRPEWRLAYKQRLGRYNHYFRLSYNNLNWSTTQTSLPSFMDHLLQGNGTITQIDSNIYWSSGIINRGNAQHTFKLGYEYQFKIGKTRSVSINMGADAILGALRVFSRSYSDTVAINFVHQGNGVVFQEDYLGGSSVYSNKPIFTGGISPFIGIGFPIRKRFDLTLEMALDYSILAASETTQNISSLSIEYRPSLMLNYRFDEHVVRSKTRKKSSGR